MFAPCNAMRGDSVVHAFALNYCDRTYCGWFVMDSGEVILNDLKYKNIKDLILSLAIVNRIREDDSPDHSWFWG